MFNSPPEGNDVEMMLLISEVAIVVNVSNLASFFFEICSPPAKLSNSSGNSRNSNAHLGGIYQMTPQESYNAVLR